MILDEIITLLFSIVAIIIEAIGLLISAIINLFIVIIELILDLTGKKRSIKKVKLFQRKQTAQHNEYNHPKEAHESNSGEYKSLIYALMAIAVIGYLVFPYLFSSHKDITFVAQDGQSLPFASVIVYHNNKEQHRRTESNGTLRVKKSGFEKIIMNDKRYKDNTWQADEIKDTVIVKRSLLGSSLDILADKLLNKDD